MAWLEVRIAAESPLAAVLSDALMDRGALSVCLEDAQAGSPEEQAIFGEPGEAVDALWANSLVVALLDQACDPETLLAQVCADLGIPPLAFTVSAVAEQDWVRLTQAQFDPIQVSSRLWITPSWHPAADAAINLTLDPGLAFGTGSHPTTWLCLQWLDATLTGGEAVLDYGCGSGILAIAAKRLGAGRTVGVDIDEQALLASGQNAERNQVDVTFQAPTAPLHGAYDLVVANILTNPLRMLAPLFAGQCRAGGQLCLSGILDSQADDIVATYAPWFKLTGRAEREGWVRLTGQRLGSVD
jgi:ribosomal protein L11 methyltransferase